MKTVLKRILVVALMLGTLTGYANDGSKVIYSLKKIDKGDRISVYDSEGNTIYSDRVEYNGNLNTLFDFSKLKDGVYTVEINKDFEININRLQVQNNTVLFLDKTQKTIYKPVIRKEESKVLISKLALDTNEMDVELYFENNLIHAEKATGKGIINRIYKLDKKERGEYTAIIKTNGRVYIENFTI